MRGRMIFTFAVGVVALLVFLTLGSRLVPKEPEATPTPTTRPTATALNPDTFHASLTARPGDPSLTVGTMATVSAAFKNTGTATWAKGTPSEVRLGIRDGDKTLSTNGMAVDWPLPDRPAVQQEASVKPGESATFRGYGVGTFVRPGAVSWRGTLLYETSSQKLARLNGIAVLFEYEVDESGKSEGLLYEWK